MPIVSGNFSNAGPIEKSSAKRLHPKTKNADNVIVIDIALFSVLTRCLAIFNIDVDFCRYSIIFSFTMRFLTSVPPDPVSA
ncbi:MAG: hypothetical protein ACREFR_08005, partial [Limisphaerales bacterium]